VKEENSPPCIAQQRAIFWAGVKIRKSVCYESKTGRKISKKSRLSTGKKVNRLRMSEKERKKLRFFHGLFLKTPPRPDGRMSEFSFLPSGICNEVSTLSSFSACGSSCYFRNFINQKK